MQHGRMVSPVYSAPSKQVQLERFIKLKSRFSLRQVRDLILQGQVRVDGCTTTDTRHPVHAFTHVELEGQTLQKVTPRYIMLNKPQGMVSATSHPDHATVIDCIKEPYSVELHLAGRLDFNSTGLLVLSNDGQWSRKLTQPELKRAKTYLVTTEDPITTEYQKMFASGMYFKFEGISLQPASLDIISTHQARLTIYEGRYHQIKRMFGHFDNKVTSLHRESMGCICLDTSLKPGEYRHLSVAEVDSLIR